ncbi:FAD-binding oxidoreductase [Acetobacter sp. TBRC 12305]|uniref:FAD-binding oxidoreductase n=1 Tax=Acetobacter garciniae TaxID=2817435 RepID=A0A939HLP5_9PROT|nr:FAD-binding oxidoreductase [Acetobacter garciniae]MBO1326758.1 FAD-binding oxidoreductase [Acetobacter garciniae]MBX0345944.1 FAD-binding oxidoreductase [Acetobacter garciniae]
MTHMVIVGAGIIGLASAEAAQCRGWKVTLVDRAFEGDRASHGNAGGIAVSECVPLSLAGMGLKPLKWLMDPLGPLSIRPGHALSLYPWFRALSKVAKPKNYARIGNALAALNNRSLFDFEAMLGRLGIIGDLHKRGALTVYETEEAFEEDQTNWTFKRERGVVFRNVSIDELRVLEPGLAPVFKRAVMIEQWAHIDDPKRIVDSLRSHVRNAGAEFITGEAASIVDQGTRVGVMLEGGRFVDGDRVLVSTGAWSARLSQTVGDNALLESERGYNTTLPNCATRLNREVIFSERMFVATPLAIGLRIGGAAEFAGLTAPANYGRSATLLKLAHRYLPNLDVSEAQQWMGNRPTTPDSLPVIGASPRNDRILYAFGHGHLGFTQAATTAELIGDLLDRKRPEVDMTPYSIARFNRG